MEDVRDCRGPRRRKAVGGLNSIQIGTNRKWSVYYATSVIKLRLI